jgi:uncharacterized protein
MHRLKKLFHLILGTLLLLLGVVGLVLPILNGVLFLLLGFILLSFESTYVERHLNKIAHKNTTVGIWYDKLDTWMKKVFGI